MTENNNHQTSNFNTEKVTPSKQKGKDSAAAKHIKNKDTQQIICISFSSLTKQNKTNPSLVYLFSLSSCQRMVFWQTFCIFRNQNRNVNINRKSTQLSRPPTASVHDIAWLKTMTTQWHLHSQQTGFLSFFFFFFYIFSSAARDYKMTTSSASLCPKVSQMRWIQSFGTILK